MRIKSRPGCEHDAFRALFENQSAWDAKHALPHKIAGVGTGGGMCCDRIAAIMQVFAEFGITHAFTVFVTVSGAGGPVGGFLSGIAHRTPKMFECLAATGFITWNPWLKMYALDIPLLERALVGDLTPFAFDQQKIEAHQTQWYVTTTLSNGNKKLHDAKKVKPHAAHAVCASSAFPGTCSPVIIEDEENYDGAVGGNPLPVEEALELLGTPPSGERPKVIVMQSRIHPKYRRQEWMAWEWYAQLKYALYAPRLRNNTAKVDRCFASAAERLNVMREVDWSRIAPTPEDTPIMPFTTNLAQLQKARDETRFFMRALLREVRPVRHI